MAGTKAAMDTKNKKDNYEKNRIPMAKGKYCFYHIKDEELDLRNDLGIIKKVPLEIEIQELLSESGSSCLTYVGQIFSTGRKVIVKEFYPQKGVSDIWPIQRREDQTLEIPELLWRADKADSKLKIRFQQFIKAYTWQKSFYSNLRLMETVVEPQYLATYGDTYYVISDFHNGLSMKEKINCFQTLREKMMLMHYLAELMEVLEKNNYIMLDLCIDNFLVIHQTEEYYQLRMFDLDSIIDLSDLENMHSPVGNIFYHVEYSSDDIINLKRQMRSFSFDDLKEVVLSQSSVVYSLGILFFEILFDYKPERKKRNLFQYKQELVTKLTSMYPKEIARSEAEEMVLLLGNMLAPSDDKHLKGFDSCKKVVKSLNVLVREVAYESYLKQEKMLDANATLAAYHMLQEHPLFHYPFVSKEGKCSLKVAILGSYRLRAGILSAIISIGQMLDTKLEIAIVSEDAKQFWEEYTSKDQNPGLKDTVIVDGCGIKKNDTWNKKVTDTPFAYVHLMEETISNIEQILVEDEYRYFVLLKDMENEILEHYQKLQEIKTGDKLCMACLKAGRGLESLEKETTKIDIHFISANSKGQSYNEKMFHQRVYRMGLKVDAYYNGAMDPNWDGDMQDIEENYKADIYNRMSSERAALHGIYKLASVGLDLDCPGIVLQYLKKLKEEEIVEQLAYLEHRSWNAYMLSVGNQSIDISLFGDYAYKGKNDWKKDIDSFRKMHPLIVSSSPKRKLPKNGWDALSKEEVDMLDELDHTSYKIYQWYLKQKPILKLNLKKIFEEYKEGEEKYQKLKLACEDCVNHMCDRTSNQELKYKEAYQMQRKKVSEVERIFLSKLDTQMRIVLDSYKERDYKQLDREIVYATLEFIIVS